MSISERNDEQLSTLAANLRLLREDRGYSIAQLALLTSLSRTTLSKLEQGVFRCGMQTIFTLAVFYGLPLHRLFLPL